MRPTYTHHQPLKEYEAFIIDIVSYLVDDFENLSISSLIDERGVLVTLTAPEQQLGRLIGHGGNTIEAVKTLARCYGSKHQMVLNLKLVPAL